VYSDHMLKANKAEEIELQTIQISPVEKDEEPAQDHAESQYELKKEKKERNKKVSVTSSSDASSDVFNEKMTEGSASPSTVEPQ